MTGRSTRHDPLLQPLHTSTPRWRGAFARPSIMPPLCGSVDSPATSGGLAAIGRAPDPLASQVPGGNLWPPAPRQDHRLVDTVPPTPTAAAVTVGPCRE